MNLTRLNPLTVAEKLTGRTLASSTRHYFKDSFFYTAANVIPRLMGFILTPIVTSPGFLTTGEYNTFSVFSNSLITVLCLMLSIQAENSVARYYYESKDDFPEFLGSLFLFTTGLAALMFIQFWFFRAQWTRLFALPDTRDSLGLTMFLWGLGCAVAQILHQVYLQLLLVQKRSRSYFFWNFLKNFLYVAFAIAFLFLVPTSKVFALVWAYAICTIALAIPFFIYIVRRMRLAFHWRHIAYAMHFSVPGLPGMLAFFLVNTFDKIVFQHNNPNLGGQYSFAYTIGALVQMASSGLFSAYMPRFYEHMNKGEAGANQLIFGRNVKLLLLAAVVLTLASQPAALLLGRSPDFRKGLPIIPIVISAYVFMYLGQCYGLYIAFRRKHIFLQSLSQIIAAILTVALNLWLWQIPALQARPLALMQAAAVATLIPYFVQWLIVYLIARFLLKEKTVSFQGLKLPFFGYLAFSAFWCSFGYTLFSR